VARDIFIRLDRCQYCGRPGFVVWDADLFTCGREVCKSLAFAEVRRRHRDGAFELPEKRLARALLAAFDTFDYALHLDEKAEVVAAPDAARIRTRERQETAHLLSELHELERRYPAPPARTAPPPRRPSFRPFVRRARNAKAPRGAPSLASPASGRVSGRRSSG
jgi:hypothetical protein